MEQNQQNSSGNVPNGSEAFRTIPNASENFGNVPKGSESFRTIPPPSEAFRTNQRKENHTLTVRETARLFEAAGVARTERSIVNWCQPNAQGVARLDAYFDPNERKYYITPQSVDLAIAEERAKAQKNNSSSEAVGTIPRPSETPEGQNDTGRVSELEKEIVDLKITNRGKDFFIEQLQKEREGLLNQVVAASRKVGELETKLLQLSAPEGVEKVST